MSTIRWGVLGAASIARTRTLPAMHKAPSVELVALASRSMDKSTAACAELGIPTAYGSYDELLADPDIEAVYLPLPNHLHCEWAAKTMEAGKHVLCEKPLSLSVDEIAVAARGAGSHRKAHRGGVRLPQPSAMGEAGGIARFGRYRPGPRHAGDHGDAVLTTRTISATTSSSVVARSTTWAAMCSAPAPWSSAVCRTASSRPSTATRPWASTDSRARSWTTATRTRRSPWARRPVPPGGGRISCCRSSDQQAGCVWTIRSPKRSRRVSPFVGDTSSYGGFETSTIAFEPVNQYTLQAERFSRYLLGDPVPAWPIETAMTTMKIIDRLFASVRSNRWEPVD